MRSAVRAMGAMAVAVLASLAGCLGDEQAPAAAPTETGGPTGLTAVAGANGTATSLPAEFLAGFRVEDVHLGVDGPSPTSA